MAVVAQLLGEASVSEPMIRLLAQGDVQSCGEEILRSQCQSYPPTRSKSPAPSIASAFAPRPGAISSTVQAVIRNLASKLSCPSAHAARSTRHNGALDE